MATPVVPLDSLASAIISEVPALLERSLKYDVENNMLQTQCSILKGRLEIIKRSISHEREKQQVLTRRLAMVRGSLRVKSTGATEFKYTFPSHCSHKSLKSEKENQADSTFSDGSPISLRSKRKGIVIDDDCRVAKRLKTFS